MHRRSLATAVLVGLLVVAAPVHAAPTQDGGDRGDIARIVRLFHKLVHHFLPGSNGDELTPPKP